MQMLRGTYPELSILFFREWFKKFQQLKIWADTRYKLLYKLEEPSYHLSNKV